MNDKVVEIGGIKIGESFPVTVAGEIGTFFGKDIGLAKEYISFIKELGIEFLKGEVLHDVNIIHDKQLNITYNTDHGPVTENYCDLLKRKSLTLKEYEEIYTHSNDLGLPLISSVYDMIGVDFLVDMNAAAIKIASQNNQHRPLIEYAAKSELPLVFDTGYALLDEVASLVQWSEDSGAKGIVLNHRPDGNPSPAEGHHLRIMQSHYETFGWPVGLSCHYQGDEMVYLAIGMGARLIEKPLYHKKEGDDLDTMYTLHFDEYKDMITKIRNCSLALGERHRKEHDETQLLFRPCLVSSADIKKGGTFNLDNISFAWPNTGIPAAMYHEINGKTAARDINRGEPITLGDLM